MIIYNFHLIIYTVLSNRNKCNPYDVLSLPNNSEVHTQYPKEDHNSVAPHIPLDNSQHFYRFKMQNTNKITRYVTSEFAMQFKQNKFFWAEII